jgi:probable rRNA maturation factor
VSNIPDNNPPSDRTAIQVEITIDHDEFDDPSARLVAAARAAAEYAGRTSGLVEVTVVTDAVIHQLNRERLDHDWPTDVISFAYDDAPEVVEGEVIISWDTARRVAKEIEVPPIDELVLYVVHGTLHLCGLDDIEPADQQRMRAAETGVLQRLGLDPTRLVGVGSC